MSEVNTDLPDDLLEIKKATKLLFTTALESNDKYLEAVRKMGYDEGYKAALDSIKVLVDQANYAKDILKDMYETGDSIKDSIAKLDTFLGQFFEDEDYSPF